MANYTDKEFSDLYQEILDNIKLLTTKWDPTVSDESDPGVVILKAFGLFADKLNYKINYRNAQNSVRNVTDLEEGTKLFSELGYQIKKRRSATGELLVRYLGDGAEGEAAAELPLFTEFSNQSGSIVYTSVRSFVEVPVYSGGNNSKLVKVQEGTAVRYSYEGVNIFTQDNLTNNLRLVLSGVGEVADNGVVICSCLNPTLSADDVEMVSDWLNVGDNFFNSVETNNLFSVGRDMDGVPFIQFYEESLPGLASGIKIWIISSSGAAGNISANRINRVTSSLEVGNQDNFIITHAEFTNGSDSEDLTSALQNYYELLGINDTLVSERDYQVVIERELGPELVPLVSKALVTGVDGYHNLVEILSNLGGDKRTILTKFIITTLVSSIFVSALKYTNDYYGSFQFIKDPQTELLIKKSIFKRRVISNELVLVGKEGTTDSTQGSTIYDKFLFDVVSAIGTVIVDTTETVEQVQDRIVKIVQDSFNSRNLTAGQMVLESELSSKIKENLPGAIDTSFYYTGHRITKEVSTPTPPESSEKEDIVTRTILKGDLTLYKDKEIQMSPGSSSITYFPQSGSGTLSDPFVPDPTKKISKLAGNFTFTTSRADYRASLQEGEFLQFYTPSKEDKAVYGIGVKVRLLAGQKILASTEVTTGSSTLIANSQIKAGSVIISATGINVDSINSAQSGTVTKSGNNYTFAKDYIVQTSIVADIGSSLAQGCLVYDGSTYNGTLVYGATAKNNEDFDLVVNNAKLVIQTSSDTIITYPDSEVNSIRVEGFSGAGLTSSGPLEAVIGNNGWTSLSSEKVNTLSTQSSTLSANFYYGIVLSDTEKTSITLRAGEPYMLGEGEHLIYSDKNLLDFVDFGSGTLLSIESGTDLVLDNLIDYSQSEIIQSLQKVPDNRLITITNTTIYTYSNRETFYLPGSSLTIPTDWEDITNSISVILEDGTTKVFDSSYRFRGGLIIRTGDYNTLRLGAGQTLSVTYQDLETGEESGTDTITATPTDSPIIATSEPLYINTASTALPSTSELRMSKYTISADSSGTQTVSLNTNYSFDSGFTLRATLRVGTGVQAYSRFGLRGLTLFEIEVDMKGSGKLRVITNPPSESLSNPNYTGITLLSSSGSTEGLGSGRHTIMVTGRSQVAFQFVDYDSTDIESSITITRFKEIDDYNPLISYSEGNDSENYSTSLSTSQSLQNRVISYIKNSADEVIPFDFFYETESPLNSPTKAMNYYDPQHPLNRSILTVFDIDYLKNNLKIVRRNRSDRS